MTKVLINAISAAAGGGITYLYNILEEISKDDNQYVIFVLPGVLPNVKKDNIEIIPISTVFACSRLLRVFWKQIIFCWIARKRKADVIFSIGNFGPFFPPAKHVLFNRNALYFSELYEQDLLKRNLCFKYLFHQLKKLWSILSILSADVNLVPTKAFGDKIRQNNLLKSIKFEVIHHGFDYDYFTKDKTPLSKEVLDKLKLNENYKRILLVSNYNYFRNFETLIKAIPYLKELLPNQKMMIVLTTDIKKGVSYGGFDTTYASKLIDKLNVRGDIVMLKGVPYSKVHHLYKLCDISVSSAYTESFGHPLVEAMSQGTPVVSADTPIHREVCKEAAIYFNVFSEEDLAQKCAKLLKDKNLYLKLREQGLKRYKDFSWKRHIESFLFIVDKFVKK